MGYISFDAENKHKYKVGDKLITTKDHEQLNGMFTKDSEVVVVAITAKGYSIADSDGNFLSDIGWII